MTFLRPEALWLVPLVLAVLLWARHRARRRPRPVTTWLLFARAQGTMPPPPAKRRPLLRDLLLVLPALLVAAALSRPVVGGDDAGEPAGEAPGDANVGIVACGVGDDGALLVSVVGAGAVTSATLSVTGEDPVEILPSELPRTLVFKEYAGPETLRIEARVTMSGDARSADDVVILTRASARTQVGLPLVGSDALHRAFSAIPGTEVFRGEGPCHLRVGAGEGALRLVVAPEGGRDPRTVSGALRFSGTDLTAEVSLESVHVPLASDFTPIAWVGDVPLVVFAGRDIVLLQDPERSRWRDHPTFPLLCGEVLRAYGAALELTPQAPIATPADVAGFARHGDSRETRAAPADPRTPLAPSLYALAALAFAVLVVRKRV